MAKPGGSLQVGILGPIEASASGQLLNLGGRKQRCVLATLATSLGHVVATDHLIDAVWGDDAADRAEHTLQVYVSNLRKLLEPARAKSDQASVLLTRAPGYMLSDDHVDLDLSRFERLRAQGRAATGKGSARAAVDAFTEALSQWRGPAFGDLRGTRWFDTQAARLDEERLVTEEDRIDAELEAGSHREVLGRLEELTAAHPFRERLRGQQMIAFYRSGRQADALGVYRRTRENLVDELGIEPGDELRQLEQLILAQDPALTVVHVGGTTEQPAPDEAIATMDTRDMTRAGAILVLSDGQQFALSSGPTLIGRAPEATVRLSDHRVSRRHAIVRGEAAEHVIEDLGSTNGTTLNGRAVDRPLELADGDVISVGGIELRVRMPRL